MANPQWYEMPVGLTGIPEETAEVLDILLKMTSELFKSRSKHLEYIGELQGKAYKKDEYVKKLENLVEKQESIINKMDKGK